jgi:hypothetical protein
MTSKKEGNAKNSYTKDGRRALYSTTFAVHCLMLYHKGIIAETTMLYRWERHR